MAFSDIAAGQQPEKSPEIPERAVDLTEGGDRIEVVADIGYSSVQSALAEPAVAETPSFDQATPEATEPTSEKGREEFGRPILGSIGELVDNRGTAYEGQTGTRESDGHSLRVIVEVNSRPGRTASARAIADEENSNGQILGRTEVRTTFPADSREHAMSTPQQDGEVPSGVADLSWAAVAAHNIIRGTGAEAPKEAVPSSAEEKDNADEPVSGDEED
jgi:hypothetical protein